MIRTKKRLRLCWLLIVLNLAFIWGNSLMPREVSSAFSKFVGMILSHILPGGVDTVEGQGQGILRKIAHFMEFCTLGVLLSWWVRMLWRGKWKSLLLPLLCGTVAACIDETIQIFVPGRGPGVRDVLIDTSGVVLGIAVMTLICVLRKRKIKQNM